MNQPALSLDGRQMARERCAVLAIARGNSVYGKMAMELAKFFERPNSCNDIRLVVLIDIDRILSDSLPKTKTPWRRRYRRQGPAN